METKLIRLKELLAVINDLNAAAALLSWDQQTYMPPAGAEQRGQTLSTLGRLSHDKFISDEVGQLLDDLAPYAEQLDPDSDDACLIRVTKRKYDKETKVTSDWVAEFAELTTNSTQIWQQARAENDFAKFQPYLEKVIELRRQYSEFFSPYDHVYDPLLDDFEPGLKTKDVQAIFEPLRSKQVTLLEAIADRPQVEDRFIHLNFDEEKQEEFGVEVISKFGFDWQRGRQDRSAHPFSTSFGINDVRITTRFANDFISSALFGTMHEAGHALYELGIDPALARTPLMGGTSLAVHESQSRLWENLVGRSLVFWEHFYPRLQEFFPSQLDDVSLETFYKGINKVEPSLIRVEADEATYNLHIMLRLEIEIALMEGSLEVKDLPQAWNDRMIEYLGVMPPNDAQGVMQDIHWSSGLVGYFSTYSLGNLISLQLWEIINQDIPDLSRQIRNGEFSTLLTWLREKVHCHGSKYEPQDLVKRVTGSKINAEPYLHYLESKYSQIYEL